LIAISLHCAIALRFELQPSEEKCFIDEVVKNELIVGDYTVEPAANDVNTRVFNSLGAVLFEKNNANDGKFAFTTTVQAEYSLCFANTGGSVKTVSFSFKTGVNAKDYTSVAKKDNLKPLEVELRRLEDTTAQIHEEMLAMKERETAMRKTNETTNARVLWYSVFSMVTLLSLVAAQIFYLKSYFKKRKLID